MSAELSAFGAEPEAIFAPEHIDVRLPLARPNRSTANPSKARRIGATGRARHHTALILRCNHDLRRSRRVAEDENFGVLLEKREDPSRSRRRARTLPAGSPREHVTAARPIAPTIANRSPRPARTRIERSILRSRRARNAIVNARGSGAA